MKDGSTDTTLPTTPPKQKINSAISPGISAVFYLGIFFAVSTVYTLSKFTDTWGYNHFRLQLSEMRLLIASVAIALCAAVTPYSSKPSSVILHMTMATIVIPSAVLYACGGYSEWFMTVTITGFVIMMPFIRLDLRFPVGGGKLSIEMLLVCSAFFVISMLGCIVLISGLRHFNIDVWRVYEFRSTARADLPGFFGYITSLMGKVFIPLIVVLGLYSKKWRWVGIGYFLGFVLFALTAHKEPLFVPPTLTVAYLLAKRFTEDQRHLLVLAGGGAILLLALSWLEFDLPDDSSGNMVGTLLFRRVLMAPAALNGLYIESFGSLFQYQWFAHNSFTLGLVSNPNNDPPPALIGTYFLGNQTWANTGFIGAGYAQAGITGVLLYGALLGLYGSLANALARKHAPALVIACLFLPMLTIIQSSDLPTAMISHGGAVSVILLMLLKGEKVNTLATTNNCP